MVRLQYEASHYYELQKNLLFFPGFFPANFWTVPLYDKTAIIEKRTIDQSSAEHYMPSLAVALSVVRKLP